VQLGVFFLFRERQPARPALGAALVGAATGAGLLAKSFPALVIPAVAAIWWLQTLPLRAAARRLAWLAASAAIVAGPWILYSHLAFPREATSATAYTLRHLTEVVEGHGGPWWMYVEQMPRFFGDLIYVPVIWFAAGALRRGAAPADRALLAWMAVPYVVFSVLATKLPAFIAIAAPALFLAQAACWDALRRQAIRNSVLRASRVVLLLLLLVLPARHLLEPSGPFEARDRHAPATARLMRLDATVGLADAVIFNLPRDVEAMFYSRYDVYSRWPRLEEAAALNERGTTIVIFSPAGEAPPVVPEHWNARILRESDLDRALAVPRPE
jgi:4-amino-4-deoxy-L-arabinose transferase-like glycosyltransferase